MKFSIIIPTYNEQQDIRTTLDAIVALDWTDFEVIVVDDSSDATPNIVMEYRTAGVKLIRPAVREGRCGARNIGVLNAVGDILVILNADVHLPRDFLSRVSIWYESGFDYVLVRSKVENMNAMLARYVECIGILSHHKSDPSWMNWTEGFSCRRELAIKAGLFPTGFSLPICAGEDGYFGENLRKLGARKKIDFDITVTHIAPASLAEFWSIRVGRGAGSPQVRRFLEGWQWPKIIIRAILRIISTVFSVVAVVPVLYECYKVAKESPRGKGDIVPFLFAWLVERVAFHVGEWTSIVRIYRSEKYNPGVKREL